MYVCMKFKCKMCDREAAAAHKRLFEDYCVVNYTKRENPRGGMRAKLYAKKRQIE